MNSPATTEQFGFRPPWTVPEGRLTLLIDADDTLWENNIYFLEVTEMFTRTVVERGIDRNMALRALNETERKNIPSYGYGSLAFARTVAETFSLLLPSADVREVEHVCEMARGIYRQEQIELLPTVAETLERLAARHELVLVTKGDLEEQQGKLERSGLRGHFAWVEVVREKDVETYAAIIRRLQLEPSRTWMIGNSPRSDINPAVRAGLSAILIPHPYTWELEIEEVEASDRVIIVASFAEAAALFLPPHRPTVHRFPGSESREDGSSAGGLSAVQ